MKEQVLCSELPSGWTVGGKTENNLALLFVLEQSEEGYDHFVVVKALKVCADGQWEVYALGQVATKATTPALEGLPAVMSPENISAGIQHLADLDICCGNGDEQFWSCDKLTKMSLCRQERSKNKLCGQADVPNLRPYTKPTDPRFKVCIYVCIYLKYS